MSQTLQANPKALVESIARHLPPGAQEDFRNLLNEVVIKNLTVLTPGGNLLQAGGAKAGASAPPMGVMHTVSGGQAALNVGIQNPPGEQRTIYHEFSYGPLASFSKDVTTLPPTTNTAINIPAPGVNAFCRMRSSYDKKSWSNYQLSATKPVSAGYVDSGSIGAGSTFNQTNYAVVSSPASGSGQEITISGTGGPMTSYVAVRGATQTLRPSATILSSQSGKQQFVGWDGSQHQLKSSLPAVLADNLEPVGVVTVGSGISGGGGATGGNGGRMTAV